MSRVIRVDSCKECCYHELFDDKLSAPFTEFCSKNQFRPMATSREIPMWCPLESDERDVQKDRQGGRMIRNKSELRSAVKSIPQSELMNMSCGKTTKLWREYAPAFGYQTFRNYLIAFRGIKTYKNKRKEK